MATKALVVASLLGLSVFGAYSTIVQGQQNGIFEALVTAVKTAPKAAFPGIPAPVITRFSGFALLDYYLAGASTFFSFAIDGDVPWGDKLFFGWAMAQLGTGWTLLILEASREGNRGGILGIVGTGVVGLLFQRLTWTVCLPIFLSVHLLFSPLAKKSGTTSQNVSVPLWDIALLPLSITLSFIAPTIFMVLPPTMVSSATHWRALAAWQLFPLWTVLILPIISTVLSSKIGPLGPKISEAKRKDGKQEARDMATYRVAVEDVYSFVKNTATAFHLPLVVLALAPVWLRKILTKNYPAFYPLFQQSPFSIFIPAAPNNAPVLTTAIADIQSGALAPLATHFLQYDLYVGYAAFLIWAVFLYLRTTNAPKAHMLPLKILNNLVIGGPAAVVAELLKERDSAVLQDVLSKVKKGE